MDKQILQKCTAQERLSQLRDNAEQAIDYSYMKQFTIEELEEMKDNLSTVMIDLNSIQEELEGIKDAFKDKMKPMQNTVKGLLAYLRDKARTVKEQVFVMIDHREGRAGYYNAEGLLVYERPIEQSEKQLTISRVIKTGTSD